MFIITRTKGQAIRIQLDPKVDPATPVGEVFADGAIEVMVAQIQESYIRLGVTVPLCFAIVRTDYNEVLP